MRMRRLAFGSYDEDVPRTDPELLQSGLPILGICYGMQLIAQIEGADVAHGHREYGRAELTVQASGGLFSGFDPGSDTDCVATSSAQSALPAVTA